MPDAPLVLTIGHSTRSLEEFLALLRDNGATLLVDVRKLPGSRRFPHFDQENLAPSLKDAGIGYLHAPGLGGRRKGVADSPNRGWRNPSFRAYADYMQTEAFHGEIARLMELARSEAPVLMCAEAVPWQCHRSLIADALTVRGARVEHILGPGARRPHALVPWAKVEGGTLTYPGQTEDLFG